MSDVTDAPKAGVKGLKGLVEKVPKWGWVAGAGGLVGFVYYKRKKNAEAAAAAASATTNSTDATNATATADQGSTSQAVDQDPNAFADYGGGGGGGSYSDPGVSTGSTDTTGSTELSDFGTLLSTLSASGLTNGPATSQNAISTSGAGTTPAQGPPPAQGVVVSNQSATPTTKSAATAPAVKTNTVAGNPRQGMSYTTGTYKGKAVHIYSGAVPGGIGPKKNMIEL